MWQENAGPWEPPPGWSYRLRRTATHDCGWSHVAGWDEVARLRVEVERHTESCPWPEPPEPVDTPSG